MNSTITRTPPLPCCLRLSTKRFHSTSRPAALNFRRENERNSLKMKCLPSRRDFGAKYSSELSGHGRNPSSSSSSSSTEDRLQSLVSEFRSLEEPLERVRRLLDYASRLPAWGESARTAENRVAGCATQVWVEVEMEEASGRMSFRADSDSEISKGFCSCLIWVLDGAEAEEVLGLTTEDFEHVNIGLHGKGHSRANTWQNVLISMQRKTRALVEAMQEGRRRRNHQPFFEEEGLSSESSNEARFGHFLLSLSASSSL